MPEFHDVFWRSLFANLDHLLNFFTFLFGEKVKLLNFEQAVVRREIYISKKRKILFDLFIEVPLRNSTEKVYFLLEHKSRKDSYFLNQINKYRYAIHRWQMREFKRTYPVVPILFSQGLDRWDPVVMLEELQNPHNDFLGFDNPQVVIFYLQKIDPLLEFRNLEFRAGLSLLKNIRKPWEDFLEDWKKILEILSELEELKKIDLIENMQDYIFKSRNEDHKQLEEAIMGKRVLTAYERTLEEGIGIGKLEGEMNKALETARRMKEEGDLLDKIIRITGLSEDQLKENGIL
jgi:predicted transposase/invertase (TIGR01784 family)